MPAVANDTNTRTPYNVQPLSPTQEEVLRGAAAQTNEPATDSLMSALPMPVPFSRSPSPLSGGLQAPAASNRSTEHASVTGESHASKKNASPRPPSLEEVKDESLEPEVTTPDARPFFFEKTSTSDKKKAPGETDAKPTAHFSRASSASAKSESASSSSNAKLSSEAGRKPSSTSSRFSKIFENVSSFFSNFSTRFAAGTHKAETLVHEARLALIELGNSLTESIKAMLAALGAK